jgi:hypothetical protein
MIFNSSLMGVPGLRQLALGPAADNDPHQHQPDGECDGRRKPEYSEYALTKQIQKKQPSRTPTAQKGSHSKPQGFSRA